MKFHLPTLEEVETICENTDAFFIKDTVVEGQNVKLVDYRLASISDFANNNAFECRGLCFVQQDNGTWERNLLLNKFFNLNQSKFDDTISWMYEDVKDKKIKSVAEKCDGSIISFVKFQNGKVRAKSKMSFESDQAVMAQNLYDNNKVYRSLITSLWDDGYNPIFELVSPMNQIVLEYQTTELILLQARKEDGSYISPDVLESYVAIWNLKTAKTFDLEILEDVASNYTEAEAREKIGDRKFQGLQEMIDFIK